MIIHSNDISSDSTTIDDPIFTNLRFTEDNFELLICHDGNNKVHCKVKNFQVLFHVAGTEFTDFEKFNHGIFRILICLNYQ